MSDKEKSVTLYGIKAIAEHVGMTERQASYRAELGQLPVFKLGRALGARKGDLDAWLAGLAATARKAPAPDA